MMDLLFFLPSFYCFRSLKCVIQPYTNLVLEANDEI